MTNRYPEIEIQVSTVVGLWTEQPDTQEKIQALEELNNSLKRCNEKLQDLISEFNL